MLGPRASWKSALKEWPAELRVWNVETGQPLSLLQLDHEPEPDTWSVNTAISYDGSKVLNWRQRGAKLKVWDTMSSRLLRTISIPNARLLTASLRKDGNRAVCGAEDGMVRSLDLSTGEVSREFKGHVNCVSQVDFSMDGHHIVSNGIRRVGDDPKHGDNTIRLWDADTGRQLQCIQLRSDDGPHSPIRVSPDGKYLAWYTGGKGTLRESATGAEVHRDKVSSGILFHPHGKLAINRSEAKLTVWDLTTGEVVHSAELREPLHALQFNPNGSHLVAKTSTGLQIWDAFSWQQQGLLTGGESADPLAVGFDGMRIAGLRGRGRSEILAP